MNRRPHKMPLSEVLGLLFLVGSLVPSCGDDPVTPEPQPGSVTVQLQHVVGGAALVTDDIRYTNRAGNIYSVVRLRTLLSNIELHSTTGTTHEVEGPFYLTSEDPASLSHVLSDVPPGTYDSVSFTFGIDESMNSTNAFVSELWNDDMAWPTPLGGGYHYMILDGFYRASVTSSDTLTYNTHLGRVGDSEPHFFEVSLSFDAVVIDGNDINLPICMDINEWYEDPNVYPFPQDPFIMNKNDVQNLLMQNGNSVFSIAVPAAAVTVHVPGDYPSIQPALDAAAAGDTVLVAPGIYTGAGNRDLTFRGKDLVMLSSAGAEVTIIDVAATNDDPHRGFLFAGEAGDLEGRNAVLDGFTILNGFMGTPGGDPTVAGSRAHDLSGAGIMIRLFSSPTIRNCIIRNCHSEFTGGGLGVEFGSNPLVENCRIEACTAGIQGGGVSLETAAQCTFVSCIITGCRSVTGGGAHLGERSLLMNCLVAGNAAERGGGLEIIFPAQVSIQHSVIWNNCAEDGSDAVFVDPVSLGTSIECSVLDLTAVLDSGSVVVLLGQNVEQDPLFCSPAACVAAPTSDGDYHLQANSPALGMNSPCGEQIGPLGAGCLTPVGTLDRGGPRDDTWGVLLSGEIRDR